MKKRNLLNSRRIQRFIIGSVLGLTLLIVNYWFFGRADYESISNDDLSSVVCEARVIILEDTQNVSSNERVITVLVPVEMAENNRYVSKCSAIDFSVPISEQPPQSVLVVDVPSTEPAPVLFYSFFLAGFGLIGFFFPTFATLKPLAENCEKVCCGKNCT